jgi:formylglycine-generating enzyme required for sulfatase activity/serine/threonine protein kinase
MASNPDPLGIAGTVLADKYRLENVVGEGGFAVVYRAEHLIWKQPVAIKCFRVLSAAPEDQRLELLDGFIQEGKLMTSLSSRTAAIVQARDVGTFTAPNGDWVPYMVLEWLEGKSLDAVLWYERTQGYPVRTIQQALTLLEPAAQALDVVHGMNIAHRDIKPANFFVIGDARAEGQGTLVKILDFGIAKVMAEHAHLATSLAQTGATVTAFTPNYGAPEQFSRTHGATGPWTDVFAMALVLIELIRGAPALEGDDYLQLAIAARDETRRPTPRALGVPVSDAVEAVFLRALAVSPKDRYRTMGELWTDLYAAAFDGQIWQGSAVARQPSYTVQAVATTGPAYPTASGSATTLAAPPPVGSTTSSGAQSLGSASLSGRPRGAGLYAGVGALVLALGAGAAFLALRGGGEAPAGATSSSPSAPSSAAAPPAPACPEGMVEIAGGSFFRGSDDARLERSRPAHRVTLAGFCIDVHEVTVAEYRACSDKGRCKRPERVPSYPKPESRSAKEHAEVLRKQASLCNFHMDGRDRHPVNCVDWAQADNYCKERGARLPTEAEWEFAARGSDGRRFPWGDDAGADARHMNACGKECTAWEKAQDLPESPRMHDEDDGYPGTAPVGSFPAGKTRHGLVDMVGNVWEWTADWASPYAPGDVTDPRGPATGAGRVIRGGAFNGGSPLWVDPAFRYEQVPTARAPGIGFRCAKSLDE